MRVSDPSGREKASTVLGLAIGLLPVLVLLGAVVGGLDAEGTAYFVLAGYFVLGLGCG